MNSSKKIIWILLALAAMFILPYLGAFIQYGEDFPKLLFKYPPRFPLHKAGFNPYIFGVISVMFVAVVLLYVAPGIYGFKKVTAAPTTQKPGSRLPKWFWIGLVIWSISLVLLWGHFKGITWFLKFIDIALWWSFSMMIDGWVYQRSGGISLMASRPRELVGIAFASVMGWMIFEYFNFFVHRNWYYPNGDQMPSAEFLCYSMLASTAVFPISFEFYSLFNTFGNFRHKYSNGLKIVIPNWIKWGTLLVCGASMFLISFFPNQLFFMVWFAPLLIFAIILEELKIWTPFTLVGKGNWSPLLLIALSWVFAGFCVECWNYFSGDHTNGVLTTQNTLYWAYSVPYVNVAHVFEMPILGYLGYLPYGVYAGIWWITFAYLLDIPTQFSEKDHQNV
ncbi:MAG: hypothetical protein JNJ58_10240 [Chitinophagaceae bacterium]|nr:hypothetical protein [Chitinophagaceae bacterium]